MKLGLTSQTSENCDGLPSSLDGKHVAPAALRRLQQTGRRSSGIAYRYSHLTLRLGTFEVGSARRGHSVPGADVFLAFTARFKRKHDPVTAGKGAA
jgi:hypothetical protein